MNNRIKSADTNWMVSWIYTKEEWQHFENWHWRRKGAVPFLWYSLFRKKNYIASIEFTGKWVRIGKSKKYFNGPVTEIRRTDISDQGLINILTITYENISKNQLAEINILIPRGKLKEAIEAQHRLIDKQDFKLN